jgi:hypothetical protein
MYILTINTGNVTEGNDNKDSNSDENSFSSDAEGKKRGGEKELLMALNFGDKQSFLFSVLVISAIRQTMKNSNHGSLRFAL